MHRLLAALLVVLTGSAVSFGADAEERLRMAQIQIGILQKQVDRLQRENAQLKEDIETVKRGELLKKPEAKAQPGAVTGTAARPGQMLHEFKGECKKEDTCKFR